MRQGLVNNQGQVEQDLNPFPNHESSTQKDQSIVQELAC